MDLNLIEDINNCLKKAERETNQIFNKLDLDNKFDEWFENLAREQKLEIYKIYQLEQFIDIE